MNTIKIATKKSAWAAGVLAVLVVTGATAWATTNDPPPAANETAASAVHRDRPEPKPTSTDTPASAPATTASTTTGASTASGSSDPAAATARGTVAATIDRDGPTQCTLLQAYRRIEGEPRLVATFEDEDDRSVTGTLRPGTYIFRASDDCDTDLAEVWVGGTNSGDARVFTVRSNATTQLGTIALVANPDLSLTFVSATDGAPVVGEPFDVSDSSGTIVWSWTTDSDGRIRTTSQVVEEGDKNLVAGTYRFRVAGNDFEQVDLTIDLRSDVSRTIELQPVG